MAVNYTLYYEEHNTFPGTSSISVTDYFSEITLDEFNKLLKEVAPKYQKDVKAGSPEEAIAAMQDKINKHAPSTSGTTVR